LVGFGFKTLDPGGVHVGAIAVLRESDDRKF